MNDLVRSTRVFLSYSRADSAFAERLRNHLLEAAIEPYLDMSDVAPGEDWRNRLSGLIETSDTVVFIVSPDSVRSSMCDWEVNYAERLGKRVLPVVCRSTEDESVPDRLKRLNYIFMRTDLEEAVGCVDLVSALAADIAWIRQHSRYGERTLEWDRAGRPFHLLIHGRSIDAAEVWRDQRPMTAPEVSELQRMYIAESRLGATRRQRRWIAAVSVIAVATTGLALFAFFQQRLAVASRARVIETLASSDFQQGTQALEKPEKTAEGLALLARSARTGSDARAATRLWTILQQRSFWILRSVENVDRLQPKPPTVVAPEIARRFARPFKDGISHETSSIDLSVDGSHVLTAIGGIHDGDAVHLRVWKADGTPVTPWFEPKYSGEQYVAGVKGYFSPDSQFLALEVEVWREAAYLEIWNLGTGKRVGEPIEATGQQPGFQFTGFTHVEFLSFPKLEDRRPHLLLLTAAVKGDAKAFEIMDDQIDEIAQNSHFHAVVLAAVDQQRNWIMSAAEDGEILVSALDGSGRLGNPLYLRSRPVELRRVDNTGLLITTEDGGRYAFELRKPLTVPLSTGSAPQKAGSLCFNGPDKVLEHPSVGRITASGKRVLTRTSANRTVSREFGADIDLVCMDSRGDRVTVTTTDFVTEIWAADLSVRLGPPLDEKRSFGRNNTPESTKETQLTSDGREILIRSEFFDPPNVIFQWFTLWDAATGLYLMDRVAEISDGISDSAFYSAQIDIMGRCILLFDSEKRPRSQIQLIAPEDAKAWLPDFVEAIGGISLDSKSIPTDVVDRLGKLRVGLAKIDKIESRK